MAPKTLKTFLAALILAALISACGSSPGVEADTGLSTEAVGVLVSALETSQAAAPISPGPPTQEPAAQTCPQPDESTLLYENQALCFLYPALEGYQMTANVFGLHLSGPPSDDGPEPVVPYMEITTLPEPAAGRDVGAVALAWIAANNLSDLPLELEDLVLDGRMALRITGEPGVSASQRTLVVVNDKIYSILMTPTDIELVRPSIDLMFATLADSLRFK